MSGACETRTHKRSTQELKGSIGGPAALWGFDLAHSLREWEGATFVPASRRTQQQVLEQRATSDARGEV